MFQGFTQETVEFMWGIRLNNNRDWFTAHKQTYQTEFYEPMKALSSQVFQSISKDFPRCGLICRVSRIYRDARRLHGQGLYKDHLWWSMERPYDGDFSAQPVFWFELGPESWSYGLGYYAARASTMAKHRARVDKNPEALKKLAAVLAGQGEFVLDGPGYAREKPCPVPELAQWYNKKSFSLIHEQRPLDEEIFGPGLAGHLEKGFRFLMPFYDYFSTLDGDPEPNFAKNPPKNPGDNPSYV